MGGVPFIKRTSTGGVPFIQSTSTGGVPFIQRTSTGGVPFIQRTSTTVKPPVLVAQIPKLKCFLSPLEVVFAQSIEARC